MLERALHPISDRNVPACRRSSAPSARISVHWSAGRPAP